MNVEEVRPSLTEELYHARYTVAHPRLQGRNNFMAFQLDGPVDQEALKKALRALVASNAALRSTLVSTPSGLMRRVRPLAGIASILEVVDAPGSSMDAIYDRLAQDVTHPFDPAVDLLPVAKLYRISDQQSVLVLVFSSYLFDAGSYGIVLKRLNAFYRSPVEAEAVESSSPLLQEFAVWQRGLVGTPRQEELTSFWRERLKPLPAIIERMPRLQPEAKRGGAVVPFKLSDQATAGLRAASSAMKVSVLAACGAALTASLARLTRTDEVAFGFLTNLRTRFALCNRHAAQGIETMVGGRFPNLLPISLAVPKSGEQRELVQTAHQTISDVAAQSDLPLSTLGLTVPQPTVTLNYQRFRDKLELPGVVVARLPKERIERNIVSQRTFQFILYDNATDLTGRLVYDDGLWSHAQASALASDFSGELERLKS